MNKKFKTKNEMHLNAERVTVRDSYKNVHAFSTKKDVQKRIKVTKNQCK